MPVQYIRRSKVVGNGMEADPENRPPHIDAAAVSMIVPRYLQPVLALGNSPP